MRCLAFGRVRKKIGIIVGNFRCPDGVGFEQCFSLVRHGVYEDSGTNDPR